MISEYPAAVIVHWPTGPTPACVKHAAELRQLADYLGAYVAVTPLVEAAECENCRNEAKGAAHDDE